MMLPGLLTALYQTESTYKVWIFLLCFLIFLGYLPIYWDRKKNLLRLPGPTPFPFLGNALSLAGPPELFMGKLKRLRNTYGPVFRLHLGSRPNVIISSPETFEKILSSNKQITKGADYRFMWSWLGLGLLTSTGSKWHSRRKMLTPAFHFKILEDFAEVMNQQAATLISILEEKSGKPDFNIFPLVTHCALDIICETAMGRSISAQQDSDSQYVKAVYRSSDLVFERQVSPWLWSDWLYSLTPQGREMKHCLDILHTFTNNVIRERKAELMDVADQLDTEDDLGRKKRVAFLDLLIRESKGGTVLSDEDIREEVDTFMFEGHDTTAASMTFTLYLLARHPDVQTRCQEELDQIFGESDRPATAADLTNMKYLESCLRESLRMYQSVPIMTRTTGEEVDLGGYRIPANTNLMCMNFILHRDPDLYPDPDQFNPDRFSIENSQGRHPYSYIPFSAGPRNCIGQKFAMMEEKILVSSVLRRFSLKSTTPPEDIPLVAELVLRPKNGIFVSVTHRM